MSDGKDKKLAELAQKIEELEKEILDLVKENIELKERFGKLGASNIKLAELLTRAREDLHLERMPPFVYGVFIRVFDAEKRLVDVMYDGRMRQGVGVVDSVNLEDLKPGTILRLLSSGFVIAIENNFKSFGDEVYFDSWVDEDRLRVYEAFGDRKNVLYRSHQLPAKLEPGDPLMQYGGFALEVLQKAEGKEYLLEETPDVTFEDIGGLDEQIEIIKNEIELPFLHPEIYRKWKILLPRGVLLFGPPGCGKTMTAKAIANHLAQRVSDELGKKVESRFINIKGPELLTKWVGETERKIRQIFARARQLASDERPVIIFFDEVDSFLAARGSGISSDVEKTIIPQFNAEIDGLVSINNIIVIGATNRQDLIDPAVLRPGRFDIKIRIVRPDRFRAEQILRKKLRTPYELHPKYEKKTREEALNYIINRALDSMFSKDEITYTDEQGKKQTRNNEFVELTVAPNNERRKLHYFDFISGAMIESIVTRAKKLAAKAEIQKKEPGLRARYVCMAVEQEYRENEDLPNTTNPDEWAKVLGIKERIASIKFLTKQAKERPEETVRTGHYL